MSETPTDTDESTDAETTEVETGFDPFDLYRNDPAATFAAHLFEGEDVRAAGVENGGTADHPVPTLCSRTTSHGPFAEVEQAEVENEELDDADNDLCGTCVDMAAAAFDDATPDPSLAPFDPAGFTVDELETEVESVEDPEELAALRAAEATGENRTTALDAIEARLDDTEDDA